MVYLAAVLAALIFRPEAVPRRWAFRLALACFVLLLALPCLADLVSLQLALSDRAKRPEAVRLAEKRLEAQPFLDLTVQVLLTLAVCFLFVALGGRGRAKPGGS